MSRRQRMLAKPAMYCCKCNYALVGLREHRCPECGTPFNLDNPIKPRRSMSRAGWVLWVIAIAILALAYAAAS